MAIKSGDANLVSIVWIGNSDRLRAELKIGQTCLDGNAIGDLSRDDLFRYVVVLRGCTGGNTAVCTLIPGFSKIIMTMRDLLPSPVAAPPSVSTDPETLLASMAQMMTM